MGHSPDRSKPAEQNQDKHDKEHEAEPPPQQPVPQKGPPLEKFNQGAQPPDLEERIDYFEMKALWLRRRVRDMGPNRTDDQILLRQLGRFRTVRCDT